MRFIVSRSSAARREGPGTRRLFDRQLVSWSVVSVSAPSISQDGGHKFHNRRETSPERLSVVSTFSQGEEDWGLPETETEPRAYESGNLDRPIVGM